MIKKNSELNLDIVDIEFPNKGVAYFDGEKIYIKNTIPEQKVLARIKRKKRKYEGRLLGVLKKSPYEIEPKCSMFSICGGCAYQHISYDDEIKFKEKMVLDILKDGNIDRFLYLGINKAPDVSAYRNKMEFSFGDMEKDGELSLGMRKRNSFYEVADASECDIISTDIQKIVQCVLSYFKNTNETFYHKLKKTGTLRHLLVRKSHFTNQILIALSTTTSFNIDIIPLKEELLKLNTPSSIEGIIHIKTDALSDVVRPDEMEIMHGHDYFYEKLLGLTFKISLFSFFQTNSAGAEKLYSIVRKFVGDEKEDIIFDLYCGTGTIAQILSPLAKKVIGIEIVKEAVISARENAKLNNIDNCEFIDGDVYEVVKELDIKPGLIVLDPPRNGMSKKAIDKIIDFNAKKIVYISCKASSLSKDLAIFIENGYTVDKVEIMDMFPRTSHVETVCLLSKLNVDHHIEVDLNIDELDLTSAESKATYDQIKEYVLKTFDLKVTSLYIAQIKNKMGIKERKNFNISKKADARVPQCPADKEEAIIDALKHFNMID